MTKTLSFCNEEGHELLYLDEIHFTTSVLESLDSISIGCIIASLALSIIVGSYFKSSFYFFMYDNRKELKNRPINILLLVQSIIQHLVCFTLVSVYTTGLLFDITYSDTVGDAWCSTIWHIGTFGVAYRNTGSFGVAIFRLMYLFHSGWIKEKIGALKMMIMIMILSIIAAELMIFGFGMGNGSASREQEFTNWCIGKSTEFRRIEHEYALLQGLVYEKKEYADLVILVSLGLVTSEFCCYVIFFRHLYLHNKGLMERKVLKANETNRRHQKNAITLFGQFYGFGIETIFYFGVFISLKSGSDPLFRVGLIIAIWCEFGLLSIVEVMTSEFLRQNLPHNRFRNRLFN